MSFRYFRYLLSLLTLISLYLCECHTIFKQLTAKQSKTRSKHIVSHHETCLFPACGPNALTQWLLFRKSFSLTLASNVKI